MILNKLFIVTISIISLICTTVLSTAISFCPETHSVEIIAKKPSPKDKSFCHNNVKETNKVLLCFECDCNLTHVLSEVPLIISNTNIFESDYYEFTINIDSIHNKVKDPPPKTKS